MSNPAFPNLLKIGMSSKDPTLDRINELNSTGVPHPFKCEYYAFVEDHDRLERVVHEVLRDDRENYQREFFKVDCAKAINIIRDQANSQGTLKYEQVFYISPEDLIVERQRREELLELEKESIERLVREQNLQKEEEEKQQEANAAKMELQNLQTEKSQLIEKYNSTKKSIITWAILLVAGAVVAAFYEAVNIALYSIAAAVFVLLCGYLVENSKRVKLRELEKKIIQKQVLRKTKPIPLILTLVLICGIVWFYFYSA